jgi:hypothetical protein
MSFSKGRLTLNDRLQIQGKIEALMQREGVDFVETFAPVPKLQLMRCLIAVGAYSL